MTLKNAIKNLLPEKLKERIVEILVQRRVRRLSRLTIQNTFDEIYKQAMWKCGEFSLWSRQRGYPGRDVHGVHSELCEEAWPVHRR